MAAARAELESLLRARKLDVTLADGTPWRRRDADGAAATGIGSIDAQLGGGLPRGHLSEIVGVRSAGRTSVLCHALAAAASRGEIVALIDTCDRFDPTSAAAVGLDISRLLWVREAGDAQRALKAATLVLQAGGFGIVAFDLADAPPRTLRSFPFTTWLRLARIVEGSQTVALLVGSEHIARSPAGVTLALESPGSSAARWAGRADRARVLSGVTLRPRVIPARA